MEVSSNNEGKNYRKPRVSEGVRLADPLAFVCKYLGLPTIGNHYVLYFNSSQNVFLSVGPHWGGLFYTLSIASVFTFFFVHVYIRGRSPWLAYPAYVLYAGTILFFLLCGCSDPGIVKSHVMVLRCHQQSIEMTSHPPSTYSQVQSHDVQSKNEVDVEMGGGTDFYHDDEEEGMDNRDKGGRIRGVSIPFCDICQVYQVNNASHCEDCDLCIEDLDHHCPWLGKCVGKGNMIWFKWFNFCWLTYLLYFIIIALT